VWCEYLIAVQHKFNFGDSIEPFCPEAGLSLYKGTSKGRGAEPHVTRLPLFSSPIKVVEVVVVLCQRRLPRFMKRLKIAKPQENISG